MLDFLIEYTYLGIFQSRFNTLQDYVIFIILGHDTNDLLANWN